MSALTVLNPATAQPIATLERADVADEVRQLADQANEATGRVTLLLASVQRDIEQTMKSVQHNAEQVEQGYLIAGEAERRLQELAQLAQHSAQLAGHISQESGAQAQEVTQIGQGVQHIASRVVDLPALVQRANDWRRMTGAGVGSESLGSGPCPRLDRVFPLCAPGPASAVRSM